MLEVGQRAPLHEQLEPAEAIGRGRVERVGAHCQHFMMRGEAERAGQGVVAVDQPAIERALVDAGQAAVEEQAVTQLAGADGVGLLAEALVEL